MTPPSCHDFKFEWVERIKASLVIELKWKDKLHGRTSPEIEVS